MSTLILTSLALAAFAANSVLCRMALGADLIDPVSFTVIRLASGALVLVPLARWSRETVPLTRAGSWASGLALGVYAMAFSLAYVSISAGVGALVLFGTVQVSMLGTGLATGERPGRAQWTGVVLACGGLVYLVSPGLAAPDGAGTALMAAAGLAWAIYSLRGRRVVAPVAATAGNFVRAAGVALGLGLAVAPWRLQPAGVWLAVLSGAVTSGLGYVVWYRALRHLTTTRAAVVQLLVPVIAALAGVLVLDEQGSFRLVAASVAILGGVALAVLRSGATAAPSPRYR